jgi:RNA:NAD 2'-phosphotransferase (TPT1/KptA family)
MIKMMEKKVDIQVAKNDVALVKEIMPECEI